MKHSISHKRSILCHRATPFLHMLDVRTDPFPILAVDASITRLGHRRRRRSSGRHIRPSKTRRFGPPLRSMRCQHRGWPRQYIQTAKMKEKRPRPLNISSRAGSERTDGGESDSEDQRRTYGDGNHSARAAPGRQLWCAPNCEHCGRTEQGRRMINVRDHAVLYLTFGRRGE